MGHLSHTNKNYAFNSTTFIIITPVRGTQIIVWSKRRFYLSHSSPHSFLLLFFFEFMFYSIISFYFIAIDLIEFYWKCCTTEQNSDIHWVQTELDHWVNAIEHYLIKTVQHKWVFHTIVRFKWIEFYGKEKIDSLWWDNRNCNTISLSFTITEDICMFALKIANKQLFKLGAYLLPAINTIV